MCLHVSHDNVGEIVDYCTGARVHGCQGCFCRHPVLNITTPWKCFRCERILYELTDMLWEARQFVYTEENRKIIGENVGKGLWDGKEDEYAVMKKLICLELEIIRIVWHKFETEVDVCNPKLPRSKMLQMFSKYAVEARKEIENYLEDMEKQTIHLREPVYM